MDSQENLFKSNQTNVEITSELRKSYINYAMSVIVARALPDVRDGLKPVQRRILYTMYKMGIMPGSQHKKVARIVGETMGKYHPHGDASVSDALVRMGQEFNTRYTLVDGQGNYGSIDGDAAAAMRYIEARLDKHGLKLLEDLDKKTVDYSENYDSTEVEPSVLPGLFPSLLANGAEGIAVGMATKIPPHNVGELIDATIFVLNQPNSWIATEEEFESIDYKSAITNLDSIDLLTKKRFRKFKSEALLKDILKFIKGPDFPTGAQIYDKSEINRIYETGRGRVLMRAVSEIDEVKGGKFRIIITELPYQVNKASLIAKIAQLVKDKKIEGISDLRDESNREGIRIVVELKRDAMPKTVQNQLYKFTELQKTFNANMLALVDGEPQLLPLRRIIELHITHRIEVITRKHEFELAKLKEREHILEGLMIALDNIDEIINLIRNSSDAESAKAALMDKFKLSEIQASAILDMQLRKLAALERKKIEEEYKQVKSDIEKNLEILGSEVSMTKVIISEFEQLKTQLGDERRTKVFSGKVGEISEEDLVAREQTLVTISEQGYIKRIKADVYQMQKRGGVGKKALTTKDGDAVRHVFKCETHDQIMFFTNKGKVYALKVYEVPEYSRTAKGIPVVNLIQISTGELVTSVLTRSESGEILDEDVVQEGEENLEKKGHNYKFLMMATKLGTVKKTKIDEYLNIRSNGLIAINLDANDELTWVKPTSGESEILIVSKMAKSIHFNEKDVRETGRSSRGVRGIRLKENDFVISMDVIRHKEWFCLTVSSKGYGKLTKIEQFTLQNRGGSGIFAARVNAKTGNLVAARLLDHPHKELLILSKKGQAVRIETDTLPLLNRQTSGVRLMKVKEDDEVAAIAIV